MGDGLREALPVVFFCGELLTARGSQAIVASAAIVFRHAPLGADPAVLFHAMEGGVEGTFLDAEDVFGNLLDVKSDAVAVHGRASEGLEDQEGERALEKVVFGL